MAPHGAAKGPGGDRNQPGAGERRVMEPFPGADPIPAGEPDSPADRNPWQLGILTTAWLLLVAAGLAGLMAYAHRPGPSGRAPERWPADTPWRGATSQPTLLVFAHPKCPCTRAVVDELAWIMTRCGERLDCRVLFVQPEGKSLAWVRSDIWRAAASIPRVAVQADLEGRAAERFGAHTSGHVLLYDSGGRLQFEGGITPSRGHRGANRGRDRIVELAGGRGGSAVPPRGDRTGDATPPGIDSTRVFGCPLVASRPPPSTSSRRGLPEP